MSEGNGSKKPTYSRWARVRFKRWLLRGRIEEIAGPHERDDKHRQHPWWQVMCLTGVDYFSTLGYQPGIAFLAAGALSPIATLILVLLTLFGALPIYSRVASESAHGEGSISMLEDLLPRWKGKLFVLCLLGFVVTDFVITMTMSAADATAHIVENPFTPEFLHHRVLMTLILLAFLGAIFLRGFKEAIGLAVVLVVVYIALNLVIVIVCLKEVFMHPDVLSNWRRAVLDHPQVLGNPWLAIGVSLIFFPKLALGLSGFETGVAVMPLVKGHDTDTYANPAGRIRNTRLLLLTAALIMSVMLLTSSIATTMLIPPHEFDRATATTPAGAANNRAIAYLAHLYLGEWFGTAYDLSTILILWFAGASALSGLLNIVPRYLPRYGMAPEWARATRPLVLVYTLIAFTVTILFEADVDAQGGAYATGVLVLMSSAAIAVTLSVWKKGLRRWSFLAIAVVFGYTTIVNMIERPEGLKIASVFIGTIIFASFISRALRSTELRVEKVELDETARAFVKHASDGTIRIIANRRDRGDLTEYRAKEKEKREDNHIPAEDPIIFFEVQPGDASEFSGSLRIRGVNVNGYRVLRAESPAVPNAIAALLLYLRDETGKIPHVYFGWSEGNPLAYLMRYVLFGEGDTAPVTHEVLRQAEADPDRRPAVHVGG
jgi:hypothetical protein